MFLDEAIWRRKYKLFPDRVEFLTQLNSHHNFTDEGVSNLENKQVVGKQAYSGNSSHIDYAGDARQSAFDSVVVPEEQERKDFEYPELDSMFGANVTQSTALFTPPA